MRITALMIFIFSLYFSPVEGKSGAVIVLYGTQCAGKSALSKELRKTLPGHIKMVKRTPIAVEMRKNFIEKVTGVRPKTHREVIRMERELPKEFQKIASGRFKKEALPATVDVVRTEYEKGRVVIFDACLYRAEHLDLFREFDPIYVLVYAPLDQLSAREQQRTLKEKRGERAQMECRKHVMNGYRLLYTLAAKHEGVDILTREQLLQFWHEGNHGYLDQESLSIFKKTLNHFQLSDRHTVSIAPIQDPTVWIDTSKVSPEKGAHLVLQALEKKIY